MRPRRGLAVGARNLNPIVLYMKPDLDESENQIDMRPKRFQCRICKVASPESELVSPCLCLSHENKYMHEVCLLRRIALEIPMYHAQGYDINNLRCELCNEQLKYKYRGVKHLSCDILCRSIKDKGCPKILWPIVIFCMALSLLAPATYFSMTDNTQSPLYIADKTGQYVILSTTVLILLILVVLLIVFFDQNLKYLELVLEKVYNFDESRSLSNHSRESSAEENQVYQQQEIRVTVKDRASLM
jgi:hypothetical protein